MTCSEPGFAWQARVYWEDTDAGGVVYYANYLRFLERARTEWLRTLGFDQSVLAGELGIVFVVRRVEVDYRAPARLDDELDIESRLTELGGAKLVMQQRIVRAGQPLVEATVTLACLAASAFKPARIPDTVLAALSSP